MARKVCNRCTATYTGDNCPFKCSDEVAKPTWRRWGVQKKTKARSQSLVKKGTLLNSKETKEGIKKVFGDES